MASFLLGMFISKLPRNWKSFLGEQPGCLGVCPCASPEVPPGGGLGGRHRATDLRPPSQAPSLSARAELGSASLLPRCHPSCGGREMEMGIKIAGSGTEFIKHSIVLAQIIFLGIFLKIISYCIF